MKAYPLSAVLYNQIIHNPEKNNESNKEQGRGGLPSVDLTHKPYTSRTLSSYSSDSSLVAVITQALALTLVLDDTVYSNAAMGVEIVVKIEIIVEIEIVVETEIIVEIEIKAEIIVEVEIEVEIEIIVEVEI